jgi:hypothetical protein
MTRAAGNIRRRNVSFTADATPRTITMSPTNGTITSRATCAPITNGSN